MQPYNPDSALIVASFNVHRWIGTDKKRDVSRCITVINEMQPDILGLQEVTIPITEQDGFEERLATATGMEIIPGPTLYRKNSSYGNLLLTKHPVDDVRLHDISLSTREPRGVIDATLNCPREQVRVLVTHLGLKAWERRKQVKMLLDIFSLETTSPMLLLADTNLWFPFSSAMRLLKKAMGKPRLINTFPSQFPVLSLDQIWANPRERLRAVKRVQSRASDHLPIKAVFISPA